MLNCARGGRLDPVDALQGIDQLSIDKEVWDPQLGAKVSTRSLALARRRSLFIPH